MANTVTNRVLSGSPNDKNYYVLVNIVSDGTEETDLVVYDNSTAINEVTRGRLLEVWASGNSCTCTLEWDQTTDSPIASFDPAYTQYLDFRGFRGVSNPGAAGATGDVLLTTGGLDSGDAITLILHVEQ